MEHAAAIFSILELKGETSAYLSTREVRSQASNQGSKITKTVY